MFLFRHSDEAPEKGIRHTDPGAPETRGTKRNAAAWPRLDALTVAPACRGTIGLRPETGNAGARHRFP